MRRASQIGMGAVGLAAALWMGGVKAMAQQGAVVAEQGDEAKWYGVFGAGWVDFEGNQDFSDSAAVCLFLGYDYNERWTLETGLHWAPALDANEDSAATWSSASGVGVSMDGLFHFTRWKRVDPYLAAGVGYAHYTEKPIKGGRDDLLLRGGAGMFYHFNDEWAVRADFRTMLAGFGDDPHANSVASAGVVWHWGARIPSDFVAEDGSDDWDKDGLKNTEEYKIGTSPYDPDTDDDGLTDGEEVLRYMTNPLEKDTDLDLLTDGAEVKKHSTDPNKRDTDNGGVMDGHEVLEDKTDPRAGHGDDDLVLYELNIEFDLDKHDLKSRYFPKLDVIGKVLSRNPGSTARVEGHCDRLWKSEKRHNDALSKNRAQAVLEYLVRAHKIESNRLSARGFGYGRPKVANDLRNPAGTLANRRVEIYIRKGPGMDKLTLPTGDEAVIQPVNNRRGEFSATPAPARTEAAALEAKIEAVKAEAKAESKPAMPEPRPEDK
ncbi:MAG: outer membrane beta-barrel protein [Verrucomicrobiota bacterium]|nr:outer membrane beta-barrel protein [Verrucomicrobiota bacterium]